jgi:hypothetical protein
MGSSDCASRDDIDQIEISSPCTVSWEEMRQTPGDGRVRFCGQCRQNVYNVEAMSRGEARRLIAAREGSVCVRILRRPDGTVVTADCWARLRAARRRGILPFLGMMLLVGLTELIAIGVGLSRLHSFIYRRPALENIEPAPRTLGGLRPLKLVPPPASVPVMGDLVAPPRLMGKIHRR